jgi:hypothetical protein
MNKNFGHRGHREKMEWGFENPTEAEPLLQDVMSPISPFSVYSVASYSSNE